MKIPGDQGGFSYVEVLIAAVLMAAALTPVMESLQTAMLGTSVGSSHLAGKTALASRAEEILSEPFGSLASAAEGPYVPTPYSDLPGSIDRIIVYLAEYDGDNADGDDDPFTGADPDLLWVRVEIEGTSHALESLTTPF